MNDTGRREIRRTLMIYLDCIDEKTGMEAGKVVDITYEGLLIMSLNPIPIGNGSSYEVILPGTDAFKGKVLKMDGICRWVRKDDVQDLYYMGIAFLKNKSIDRDVIDLLISRIGFSDGQKKIFTAVGEIEYK